MYFLPFKTRISLILSWHDYYNIINSIYNAPSYVCACSRVCVRTCVADGEGGTKEHAQGAFVCAHPFDAVAALVWRVLESFNVNE